MSDIRRIRFQAVPSEFVGDGKLVRGRPHGDELLVLLHEKHISQLLCEQLTEYHKDIIGKTLTHEDEAADGMDPAAGRVITNGRYEFVPTGVLPEGRLCWPVHGGEEFIWQIQIGEMTEELRQEFNTYIAESLATHQWVQH